MFGSLENDDTFVSNNNKNINKMHEEWIIYLLELKEYLFELEALGLKNTSEWCDANEAVWQVENYL